MKGNPLPSCLRPRAALMRREPPRWQLAPGVGARGGPEVVQTSDAPPMWRVSAPPTRRGPWVARDEWELVWAVHQADKVLGAGF